MAIALPTRGRRPATDAAPDAPPDPLAETRATIARLEAAAATAATERDATLARLVELQVADAPKAEIDAATEATTRASIAAASLDQAIAQQRDALASAIAAQAAQERASTVATLRERQGRAIADYQEAHGRFAKAVADVRAAQAAMDRAIDDEARQAHALANLLGTDVIDQRRLVVGAPDLLRHVDPEQWAVRS